MVEKLFFPCYMKIILFFNREGQNEAHKQKKKCQPLELFTRKRQLKFQGNNEERKLGKFNTHGTY